MQGEFGGDDCRHRHSKVSRAGFVARYSEWARWILLRPTPTPAGDKPPRYISPPRPLDSGFRRSDELGYPDSRPVAEYRVRLAATTAGVLEMEPG